MSKTKNILIPELRFPEFVDCGEWEKITIGNIEISEISNISLNKLNIKDNGYAVYGVDGIVGYIDNYQQKIASCFSSLDDLIIAQTEKIEQLKQHKKGLMQGLFPITN